ncbi:hypothetical protein GQ43DRAFT_363478 [Delitschia confertaspora ATCC 74209]|uniref:WIBG Mago-binding domain-containing protein n=1 Tax=Delitschia confertaspora ATCC 74209 TaxID=1513339 RepID=A0A9P4JSV7_9PLEO|nr:hypothetical protein GQ43DRAFT_363478 [Delitschia confertaspora ATCC 74209]
MSSTGESTPSKAGIVTLATGEKIVPQTRRADGTVRAERRVRPGYAPPEDREVYRNRTAEAWKNRGSGGIPGAEGLKTGIDEAKAKLSVSANKNAKRREARKKAAATAADADGEDSRALDNKIAENQSKTKEIETETAPAEPLNLEAEKEKEAKKLVKKVRQARELRDKKEKGDALLPEQFAKVIKINELIRQLDSLGFDANGEKKTKT